jgi:hypothetical protein
LSVRLLSSATAAEHAGLHVALKTTLAFMSGTPPSLVRSVATFAPMAGTEYIGVHASHWPAAGAGQSDVWVWLRSPTGLFAQTVLALYVGFVVMVRR